MLTKAKGRNQNIKKDIVVTETSTNLISKPVYENVWNYIKQNNKSKSEIILNDQVLSYMNMHLKDLEKFKEYLMDEYSRFRAIEYAWNKVNELYSYDVVRKQLLDVFDKYEG